MKNFWIAIAFSAGFTALIYSKFGRRIGYGNPQAIWTVMGIVAFMSFVFLYTMFVYVLHLT
jgi:hypothetical protein